MIYWFEGQPYTAEQLQNLGFWYEGSPSLLGGATGEGPTGPTGGAGIKRVAVLDEFAFQNGVKSRVGVLPTSAIKGDRYLYTVNNYIYYCSVTSITSPTFVPVIPFEGWMVWVDDENIFYKFDGSTWSIFSSGGGGVGPTGPTGPTGAQGIQGATGSTGVQGLIGATGLQGEIGPTGPTGINGLNGSIGPTGPQGITGPTGLNGTNGLDGATGAMGVTGPTGPQGIQGPTGADSTVVGPTGPTGATGPLGSTYGLDFINSDLSSGILTVTHNLGQKYPAVTVSNNNSKVIIPFEITYVNTTSLTIDLTGFGVLTGTWHVSVVDGGPQGPTGAASTVAGPTGATGAQGIQGPTGATGDASTVAGPTGPTGATGTQGSTGPTGPTGPTGSVSGALGTWVDKSSSYGAQQAPADGFVQGYMDVGSNSGWASYMYAYTDSSSNPTTVHGYAFGISPGYPYDVIQRSSFCMPVKKGDYWKVVVSTLTGGSPSVTIWWIPLGT